MVLADNEINKYVNEGYCISKGFKQENLKGIAYELTVDYIIYNDEKQSDSYELNPGEFVYIKTNEELNIPKELCGKVVEKNSLQRLGLVVDAPVYIPGHKTFAFLRVRNLSRKTIKIKKDLKIAQIMFEQLSSIPEQTYDVQENASYRNEEKFKGLSNYKKQYKNLVRDIDEAKSDLEKMKVTIYSNVITIMGIIAGIFAIITTNTSFMNNSELNLNQLILINLTLANCITMFMGIILLFINPLREKKSKIIYFIIQIVLLILLGIMYFCKIGL